MKMRIPLALACTASLFSLLQATPVRAQADQPAASTGGLEEIVVTARRKEEKLQNVPVAITAFTPKAIEENHIESASDLAHFVPALASSQETRDEQVFYLRGQGPNGGQGGAPGVVTYFAEVPFSGSGPGIYFDLDNLQVLRGPQGTLFGRNTTGGAVLFEPKKPTNNFEGYLSAQFGDYNLHGEEGAINIPIIDDKLLVRAAFNIDQRDGFTHDYTTGKDLDNRDYWAFRWVLPGARQTISRITSSMTRYIRTPTAPVSSCRRSTPVRNRPLARPFAPLSVRARWRRNCSPSRMQLVRAAPLRLRGLAAWIRRTVTVSPISRNTI